MSNSYFLVMFGCAVWWQDLDTQHQTDVVLLLDCAEDFESVS
jgi:hypothetical protein